MPEYKCPKCGHITYRTLPQKRITCVKCGRTWEIEFGGTIEIVYPERDKVPRGYLVRGRTLTPKEFQRKVREAMDAGMNFFDYVEKFNPEEMSQGEWVVGRWGRTLIEKAKRRGLV